MNDEQRLHEQLERVTAAGRQTPAGMDDDSAALRKTWLVLGDLLDQAAAGQDTASRSVVDAPREQTPATPRRWSLTTMLAVAASLLVSVGLATSYLIRQEGATPGSNVERVAKQSAAADAGSDLRWDDALDEEIDVAQQAALVATSDWYAQSAAVEKFNERIQQIQSESGNGTF